MTKGTQAIKFGTWLRDNRDANTSSGGFNGSFTFASTERLTQAHEQRITHGTACLAGAPTGGSRVRHERVRQDQSAR